MNRHRLRTLGIRLLAFSSIALASSLAVLTFTGGPAAAQNTTSCPVLNATFDRTPAFSGSLSRCGDKEATGGGGTFAFAPGNLISATITWKAAGNTSELTGSAVVLGVCKGGDAFLVSGMVTGGNTFVGDSYSFTVCVGKRTSLVKGTGGFVI